MGRHIADSKASLVAPGVALAIAGLVYISPDKAAKEDEPERFIAQPPVPTRQIPADPTIGNILQSVVPAIPPLVEAGMIPEAETAQGLAANAGLSTSAGVVVNAVSSRPVGSAGAPAFTPAGSPSNPGVSPGAAPGGPQPAPAPQPEPQPGPEPAPQRAPLLRAQAGVGSLLAVDAQVENPLPGCR